MATMELSPSLEDAWAYVNGWAARTASERTKNNHDEDGILLRWVYCR